MALQYIEFDTTQQALLTDLRTHILESTDWTRLTADTILATTSGATAVNATSLPVANANTVFTIGQVIMIDDGANREWRTITNLSASTVTVAAMSFAHASGVSIRSGQELYKATTTRGAQMVFDLADSHPSLTNLNMAVYRQHDGVTGTDEVPRYLYWRATGGAVSNIIHVTLSISKEHIFFSLEGPRGSEVNPQNSVYGSLRNYFFMCDLVPYDTVNDTTPVVVAGGAVTNNPSSSVVNLSHVCQISRNLANTSSWAPTKLATLAFPLAGLGATINHQHVRSADSTYVLAPYVAFADDSGMRGRLNNIFFAGFNQADNQELPTPPIGAKVTYQGQLYKIILSNMSDASRDCWGALGGNSQASGTIFQRSICIAVPCL